MHRGDQKGGRSLTHSTLPIILYLFYFLTVWLLLFCHQHLARNKMGCSNSTPEDDKSKKPNDTVKTNGKPAPEAAKKEEPSSPPAEKATTENGTEMKQEKAPASKEEAIEEEKEKENKTETSEAPNEDSTEGPSTATVAATAATAAIVTKTTTVSENKASEKSEKADGVVLEHRASCDGCTKTICGIRYKCANCDDHDLCEACYTVYISKEKSGETEAQDAEQHPPSHSFLRINFPLTLSARIAFLPSGEYSPTGGDSHGFPCVCCDSKDITGTRFCDVLDHNFNVCGDCLDQQDQADVKHGQRRVYLCLREPIIQPYLGLETSPFEGPSACLEHPGFGCDGCEKGITGVRYTGLAKADYDLCQDCYEKVEDEEEKTEYLAVYRPFPAFNSKRPVHTYFHCLFAPTQYDKVACQIMSDVEKDHVAAAVALSADSTSAVLFTSESQFIHNGGIDLCIKLAVRTTSTFCHRLIATTMRNTFAHNSAVTHTDQSMVLHCGHVGRICMLLESPDIVCVQDTFGCLIACSSWYLELLRSFSIPWRNIILSCSPQSPMYVFFIYGCVCVCTTALPRPLLFHSTLLISSSSSFPFALPLSPVSLSLTLALILTLLSLSVFPTGSSCRARPLFSLPFASHQTLLKCVSGC